MQSGSLGGKVQDFCNPKPFFVTVGYDTDRIKRLMLENGIGAVPVIDPDRRIVDVIVWEAVFSDTQREEIKSKVDLPVVIMAGGRGTRLDPFTRILPKSLLPINDKSVIEIIIERFRRLGAQEFYISINHKSRMIKAYFEELNPAYRVKYIEESDPMGTAGSLRFLKGLIKSHFFVTNCDILLDCDYGELQKYHANSGNDLTLVVSVKHYRIPYGVCEIKNGGLLSAIREKPEYNMFVNTGMYVLNPDVLELIPESGIFHITALIEKVQAEGGTVRVFPVSEKSWVDIGEWEEYKKVVEHF